MFENKRPVGILRYNAEIMRDNGAPQEVIAKYLSDNGSSFKQIMSVPTPNQEALDRMLQSEKDGSFETQKQVFNVASEKARKRGEHLEGMKQAQAGLRAFGNGLFFGFGDEVESAVTGIPIEQIRAEQKQYVAEHPYKSTAYNVVGAIANPVTRAIPETKGTLLGSNLLAKVASGAAQGSVYGGLYGLGEGEGGFENRLTNAGKYAKTGAAVGAAIPVAVEGVKAVGRGIADVAGQASGAGGESLKRGFDAGKRNSQVYKDAMRRKAGVYDVVDDVDNAVRTMERNASAKYKAMLPDNGATLKLPDTEFKKALNEATKSISGVTSGVDDTAANAINKVHKLAQNIRANGGMTFNNVLEAKKAVDGIIEPLSRAGEKNAVRLLTPIKNALNSTLESAVPEYNGARAAFRADSRLIDSIKSALTSKDPTTELRKLQGITRQSVAAAQGGKQELGRVLDSVSGGRILDAIAGGQVQQLIPRDPVRSAAAAAAAFGTKALSANPFGIATIGAFSPRLSGEVAFKLGQVASKLPQTNTNAVLRVIDALQKR